jgi:hypothetical protein
MTDIKNAYTAIGKHRASKRRLYSTVCTYCEKPIVGTARKRFCSPQCRNRYDYQQRKQYS